MAGFFGFSGVVVGIDEGVGVAEGCAAVIVTSRSVGGWPCVAR